MILIISFIHQVRILGVINPEDEGIPSFENIFNESDDEDIDDETVSDVDDDDHLDTNQIAGTDSTESRAAKIQRQIQKRRDRRKWEENRNKIMFDYTQYSYYGKSSAMLIFELAWKLTKDSIDLLWWAIVGITEQLILGKIESSTYVLETERIQSHVSRLSNKSNDNSIQTGLKISYEKDLHLSLYRHWSVYESLKNSLYSSCKLKLWTLRGEKKLHELLVEMGLPLVQAKQTFNSMDLVLRKEFYEMIEKLAEKYNLPDIVYVSFTLQYGYRNRYSAADYVYSMLAILESIKRDRTPEHCFLEALDSLSRTNKSLLDDGIEQAKLFLSAIFKQVQSSIECHQVSSAGPFLYFILNEENVYFSCPYGLLMLTKFMLHGHVSMSRSRRAPELPMVACCPIDIERGLSLIIGIPPLCENSPKNFFGKAFEQAAVKSNAVTLHDFFETSTIQIKHSDLKIFLDGLTVLLS